MPAHELDGSAIPALDGSLPPQARAEEARTFSAYVHIPFCAVRCGYCDFNTYTAHELGGGADLLNYAQTLLTEVELSQRVMAQTGIPARALSSVFFGGGTPTLLPGADLAKILVALQETFGLEAGAEVTVEANPDTITAELVQTLADAGVNRVSIGMQSAVPHVLEVLDRTHDPARIPDAVELVKAAGLQVSLDLIYGTPGESVADYRHTLELVTALEPDHVSAYALIIEEGTKLAAQMKRGVYPYPNPDDQAEKYELTDQLLNAAGYQWYELSNWARSDDRRSAHNRYYWLNQDWWGYGPGAHGHLGNYRFWNVKHPRAYADRLQAGHSPALGMEIPDEQAQLLEDVLLQTRLVEGMAESRLGLSPQTLAHRCTPLLEQGLIDPAALERGRIVLTLKGRLLADEVVRRLLDF
ncbi:radical SAM family heme chaperone HemW [Micrococcoides hystricis]|uniref:Heme chaperone HemW n=1 Tax=Micrococcoides hystricis TaxID=1572761 RepID=A0ABV6P7E3_9MICC